MRILTILRIGMAAVACSLAATVHADGLLDVPRFSRVPFSLVGPAPNRDLLTCELFPCIDLSVAAPRSLFRSTPPTSARLSAGGAYIYLSFGEQESAVMDASTGRIVSWTHD